LRNLPRYAAEIWDSERADYMHLMPLKEKRKREKELAAEAEEESEVEETHPGTPGSAVNDSTVVQWKNIKRYIFDMRDIGQLMRINVKLSVKQVANTSPKPNKCDPMEWDTLPWDGVENNLEDVPIHPCISRLWRALFSRENKTPLQKLMVAVNNQSTSDSRSETLTKKDMIEAFDINILHIENIRNQIERMDETCRDIVDDLNFENRDKDANIPETFITWIHQMEQELTGLDKSIFSGISELQDLRFNFVPTETQKRVQHQAKERGVKEIAEQIIWGV
jgi:hypothetical protein